MRILYLDKNDEYRRASTSWYLKKQLASLVHIMSYGPGYPNFKIYKRWDVSEIVSNIQSNNNPDIILIDHYWKVCRKWKNLDKINIPKALIISDPHHEPFKKADFIRKNKIDLSLFVYKFSINQFKNKIDSKMEWLPWSVNTSIFKDYGFERKYDVTFLGTVGTGYPLRKKILEKLPKRKDIKFYTKKPPREWNLNPTQDLFKENYAKILAQSKIFIFGTSIHNYPVAKFFEAMASNTLVMAPMPLDGEDLNFKSGYNFVEINEKNFMDKIYYYLKHEDERKIITKNGVKTIEKFHTVKIRAKQLVDYLNYIKN